MWYHMGNKSGIKFSYERGTDFAESFQLSSISSLQRNSLMERVSMFQCFTFITGSPKT